MQSYPPKFKKACDDIESSKNFKLTIPEATALLKEGPFATIINPSTQNVDFGKIYTLSIMRYDVVQRKEVLDFSNVLIVNYENGNFAIYNKPHVDNYFYRLATKRPEPLDNSLAHDFLPNLFSLNKDDVQKNQKIVNQEINKPSFPRKNFGASNLPLLSTPLQANKTIPKPEKKDDELLSTGKNARSASENSAHDSEDDYDNAKEDNTPRKEGNTPRPNKS